MFISYLHQERILYIVWLPEFWRERKKNLDEEFYGHHKHVFTMYDGLGKW